jgi:predicted RecA/RadA family phage recombinase
MKNFIQPGGTISLTAPYTVLSGAGLLVGAIFGVASFDAAINETVEAQLTGVFELPKTSALAIAVGDRLYWDNTAKLVNKTSSGNTLVGAAVSDAANPSATVLVRLNGSF